MNELAIKVENLSKKYRIGIKEEIHDTFVANMVSWIKSPFSNFNRLKKLSKFNQDENASDIIMALRDINFSVKKGEIIGIIGSNGAGKSTLLKILAKIVDPTNGSAVIDGRVASLLEVGTGFHPELTGRENVFLNGTILGMSKKEIESKFDEIIEFSGIEKFTDTPVKRYSSGMSVRLAFAVAAHLEPEILLIDEVLAVGDIRFQKKCIGKMNEISKGGRTVFFVSHNMGAIQDLCSRVLLLEEGKIIMDDSTDKVLHKYLLQGSNKLGEKLWVNEKKPGDETVKLSCVRVLNDSGEVSTNFTVRNNIFLQMEFELLEELKYLDISFYIHNERGNLVLSTFDYLFTDESVNKSPGLYRSTCQIKKDFLNEGQYFIKAGLTGKGVVHTIQPDIVSLIIADSKDPEGSRGLYHDGKWPPAIVRPKLNWETENISNI